MEVAVTDKPPKSRRRRRLQFGMRTLLGLLLVTALVVGKISNDARRQRAIVQRIEALGGKLWYAHEEVAVAGPPPGPGWLRELLGNEYFDTIRFVQLDRTAATNDDVAEILAATSLRSLSLDETTVTGEGLQGLGRHRDLERLSLYRTQVKDDDLACLRGCSKLRSIRLPHTSITDAGIRHLSTLMSLDGLYLQNTRVTNAALGELAKLQNLDTLYLDETAVTAEGLSNLRGLDKLHTLSLIKTKVSGPGLESLTELPALRLLLLGYSDIDDDDAPRLAKLHQLEGLFLHGTRITDRGLLELSAIRPQNGFFLHLACDELSSAGIAHLERVPGLAGLGLWKGRFTDDTLATAPRFNSLQWLALGDDGFTDAGLMHLNNCQALTELTVNMNTTKITDAGLDQLQSRMPLLKIERDKLSQGVP